MGVLQESFIGAGQEARDPHLPSRGSFAFFAVGALVLRANPGRIEPDGEADARWEQEPLDPEAEPE